MKASTKKLKRKTKTKAKTKPAGARKVKSAVRMSSERIGVLGGTFNPIHVGHLNSAMTVRETLKLNRVLMVPAYSPPHRQLVGPAPEDRLSLLRAAVNPYEPELTIDEQELKRKGTSYTVETLRELNKTHKAQNIYFIMGADAFMNFPRWKSFEELLTLANFAVTTRPGVPLSLTAVDLPMGLEQFVKACDRNHVILNSGLSIVRVELDDVDISSTDLRKKLRNGQDVKKWIPTKALDIINQKGLYKRSSPLVSDYREFAIFCARHAFDKKAIDLKVYDMVAENSYADYSIICSATSSRHGASVAQGILDAVKDEYGLTPISLEGMREGQWVLVDFGTVVIHIFQDVVRQQYHIEDLWKTCPQIQKEVDPRLVGRQ